MIDETFLTTEEVLEYLQVNLRTVYRLIKAGKIPAVRVGRQWRFRKRDIDAWLDSQRPRGGARAPRPRPAPPRAAGADASPRPRRRRRSQHSRSAVEDARARRIRRGCAPDGRSALERHAPVSVRPADRGPEDAGYGWAGRHSRSQALQGRPAGDHHHRVLDRSRARSRR